jgi:hypothetical protein
VLCTHTRQRRLFTPDDVSFLRAVKSAVKSAMNGLMCGEVPITDVDIKNLCQSAKARRCLTRPYQG